MTTSDNVTSGSAVVGLSASTLLNLPNSVDIPSYDRTEVRPGIVHFGLGNFHRSHQAMYVDRLLNLGRAKDWGIHGVGIMPPDRDHLAALQDQDNLYTLMVRGARGEVGLRVIGSIVSSFYGPDEPEAVLRMLADPTIRIVTLTVTEGGYNIDQITGEFDQQNEAVLADLDSAHNPQTVFGYVVEGLARRRAAGIAPFAVVSCDNLQNNGQVARNSFAAFAEMRDPELAGWIRNHVPFPNSMVDRITPVTTEDDLVQLRAHGLADSWPVVSEPFTQWVLEDRFPAGRPDFDQVGVQLTSDVLPYELMKLRLLNVGHQILAYAGHLSGYTYVHEVAADPVFVAFLRGYMYDEARPTLLPVHGIDLDNYIETLLERFTNPYLGDTVARLCAWSSDRIPKWHVPVVEHNLLSGAPIRHSATLIASWARYAEGVDENGRPIEIVDIARAELQAAAQRRDEDPLAFLRIRRFFGDLPDDPRFAAEFTWAMDSLHESGARATLAAVNRDWEAAASHRRAKKEGG